MMIGSYFRERFRPTLFAPVAACIALAAAGGAFHPLRLTADACFAALLLAEFRLWDDLADRRSDARTHPGRVLVRAQSVRPLIVLCGALFAVNLLICVAMAGSRVSLTVFVSLHAALGVRYAVRSRRTIAGDQLLLAKYPAFVVIVAGARMLDASVPIASAALATYAAASVYEAWHDPASPVAALLGGRS
jgi:hypothetical protein